MTELQIIKSYAKHLQYMTVEIDIIGMLVNFLAEIETARDQKQ